MKRAEAKLMQPMAETQLESQRNIPQLSAADRKKKNIWENRKDLEKLDKKIVTWYSVGVQKITQAPTSLVLTSSI